MTSIASVVTKNVHNVGTHKSVGSSCLALKRRYFPEGTEAAFNDWCGQQLQAFAHWSQTHTSPTLGQQTLDSLKQFVSSKCLAPLEPFDKFTIDNTTYVIPFKQVLALVFAAASDTNTLLTQGQNRSPDAEITEQNEQRERLRCALNTAKNEGLCGDGYRQTLLLTLQGVHPDVNIITDIPLVTGRLIFEYYIEKLEQHPHFFTLLQDALRVQSAYCLEEKPSAELTDFVTQHQNNCIEHIHTFFKNCGIFHSDQDSLRPDMLRAQLTPEGIALHDDKRNPAYSQLLALFQYQPTQDRARPVSDYVFARMTECKNFADFKASPWRDYPLVRSALYFLDKVPLNSISEDPNHTELVTHCQALVDIRSTWNDPVFSKETLAQAVPTVASIAARFLTAYNAFRRSHHMDFVTNFFVKYFALPSVAARSRLLSDLIQFNLPMLTDNELTRLFAPQENNVVFLEPETIDRFLLHAFLYAPTQWTGLYQALLRTLIDWVEQPQNHADWKTVAALEHYQPLLKMLRAFLTLTDVAREPQPHTLEVTPIEKYFPPLWLPQSSNLTVWGQFLSMLSIDKLADGLRLLPDAAIQSLFRHPPLKQQLRQCNQWLIIIARDARIELSYTILEAYRSLNDNGEAVRAAIAHEPDLFRYVIRDGNVALINRFVDIYKSLNDNNKRLEEVLQKALCDATYAKSVNIERIDQLFNLYKNLNDNNRALNAALVGNSHDLFQQAIRNGYTMVIDRFVDAYKSLNDNNTRLEEALRQALHNAIYFNKKVEHVRQLFRLYKQLNDNNKALKAVLVADNHELFYDAIKSGNTEMIAQFVDAYKSLNDNNELLGEALRQALRNATFLEDAVESVRRLFSLYEQLNDNHKALHSALTTRDYDLFWWAIQTGNNQVITLYVDTYKRLDHNHQTTLLQQAFSSCFNGSLPQLNIVIERDDTSTLKEFFIACHPNYTGRAREVLLNIPLWQKPKIRHTLLQAAEVTYQQTHQPTVCIPESKDTKSPYTQANHELAPWVQHLFPHTPPPPATSWWQRLRHWFFHTLLDRPPIPNPPPIMARRVLEKYSPMLHPYVLYEPIFQQAQQLLAHFDQRRQQLRSTPEINSCSEKAELYDTLIRTLSAHRDAAGQRYTRQENTTHITPIASLPFSDCYDVRSSHILGSLTRCAKGSHLAPPAATTMTDQMARVGIFSTQTLRDVRSAIAIEREFSGICEQERVYR